MELCEYNPQHCHQCPSHKDMGSSESCELLEPGHASLVMESFLEPLPHLKTYLCKELAGADIGQLVNPEEIAQVP